MSARAKSPAGSEARKWLERSAKWRCLSLLFQLPTRESRKEVRRIAAEVPRELRKLAEQSTSHSLSAAEMEYHRVLGAGGIPAVESSYDDNALAGRGPVLADVRAFYEAFSYQPKKLPAELPDHIAVELDFLAYLAMKIAFALHESMKKEAHTAEDAYERFLQEHLCEWAAKLETQVERAASPVYGPIAQELTQQLKITLNV